MNEIFNCFLLSTAATKLRFCGSSLPHSASVEVALDQNQKIKTLTYAYIELLYHHLKIDNFLVFLVIKNLKCLY